MDTIGTMSLVLSTMLGALLGSWPVCWLLWIDRYKTAYHHAKNDKLPFPFLVPLLLAAFGPAAYSRLPRSGSRELTLSLEITIANSDNGNKSHTVQRVTLH